MEKIKLLHYLWMSYHSFSDYYQQKNIRNFNITPINNYLNAHYDNCYFSDDDYFEYFRLFVGPDRLAAAPFESVYKTNMRLTMQEDTLRVRKCYEKAGLMVKEKNTVPDDHLGIELEFACYLIGQIGRLEEKNENTTLIEQEYFSFFKEHLLSWVPQHCEEIINVSSSKSCVQIAKMLNVFIKKEAQRICQEEFHE